MARLTCEAALGTGCVIGAAVPAYAAQWSIAPTVSMGVADDSNPYLSSGYPAVQSATFTPSAVFQYSTETLSTSVTPWLNWQRMDRSVYSDVADRRLAGSLSWLGERTQLSVQASIADYTTLSSELLQTGIVANDIQQRNSQAQATWTWQQSELHSLVLQASWLDLSYYGANSYLLDLLRGYKYPSVSAGERFALSPQTNVTFTAFDSETQSSLPGADSRQTGVQAEYAHHFTERTSIDAYVGGSQTAQFGARSIAGLGGLTLSLATERGHLDLNYSDMMQPYGYGLMSKRQSLTLSATESLTQRLDLQVSLARIDNNATVVRLDLDRSYYDQAMLGLNWHFSETWQLGVQAGATHSQTLPEGVSAQAYPATGWRTALNLTWNPNPITRSQ